MTFGFELEWCVGVSKHLKHHLARALAAGFLFCLCNSLHGYIYRCAGQLVYKTIQVLYRRSRCTPQPTRHHLQERKTSAFHTGGWCLHSTYLILTYFKMIGSFQVTKAAVLPRLVLVNCSLKVWFVQSRRRIAAASFLSLRCWKDSSCPSYLLGKLAAGDKREDKLQRRQQSLTLSGNVGSGAPVIVSPSLQGLWGSNW